MFKRKSLYIHLVCYGFLLAALARVAFLYVDTLVTLSYRDQMSWEHEAEREDLHKLLRILARDLPRQTIVDAVQRENDEGLEMFEKTPDEPDGPDGPDELIIGSAVLYFKGEKLVDVSGTTSYSDSR